MDITKDFFSGQLLQGGINFRDLGDIPFSNGQRIKVGKLFRSGALNQLTECDQDLLQRYNINQIIDYRDISEINEKPDRIWAGAQYIHAPADPLAKEVNANLAKFGPQGLTDFDAKHFMHRLYELLPIKNPAYHQLVHCLQHPENGGIIQHCAVGKDRTGVGAAIVLLALGADEDTVMEDYLLTDHLLAPYRQRLLTDYGRTLPDDILKKLNYVYSVQETFLQTSLKSIIDNYGSVERWLEQDLGLCRAARENLQSIYLA